MGSTKKRSKSGRPKNVTNVLDIMQTFVSSILKIALEYDVSMGSVGNILKQNKFHPYKVIPIQELLEYYFVMQPSFYK